LISEKYKVEATFFTLGYLAKRHPELIEQIVSKGHEISSHSFAHRDVMTMTKQEFEDDLVKSLDILRKISGEQPLGFRAPRFSINKNSFWAFSVLQKHLKYDSSIFPANHIHYGIPDAPRGIYKMSHEDPLLENEDSNFTELPLATLPILGYGNFPIAGGFWLRLIPLSLIKFGIKKLNKSNLRATFYIHPHDLDPDKPKIPGYPWHAYWNLSNTSKKLESLLKNFKFSPVREAIFNQ